MSGSPRSRAEAQRRADRVRAFQEELAAAVRDGAADFTPDQLARLAEYHDSVLAELSHRFDVDLTPAQKRAALGMRVATVIGACALAASLVLYVSRKWGFLAVPVQVGLLLAAPLACLALLELVSRRQPVRYLASVIALVAFAAFVLNVEMLGQLFALTPTPEALLAYGVFAVALAYGYDQRVLLVAGALCLAAWLAACGMRFAGEWWMGDQRPEAWLVSAIALLAWSQLPHGSRDDFRWPLRALGVALGCLAVFVLGRHGQLSWIPAEPRVVSATYQVMLFVLAATAIAAGVARHWTETVALGCLFFIVALFTTFADWWWASMPRYLFFLVIGLASLGLLWLFGRVRAHRQRP